MDNDALFAIRNYFWLGNYELALQEANSLSPSNDRQQIDRDVILYRSYIEQGKSQTVLTKINDNDGVDLQSVKLFAAMVAHPDKSKEVLGTFVSWLNDETSQNNETLQLMAGLAHLRAGDTTEALRALKTPQNLEHCALRVQTFLFLNRIDLAYNEVTAMQRIDDDCTLTQLSQAWCHLASGDPKNYQEAVYLFNDQMEKTISSPMLLSGIGMAHMQLNRFDEAEKYLLEAHAKMPSDADILANLISCTANLGKPMEKITELTTKLGIVQPENVLLKQLNSCIQIFN